MAEPKDMKTKEPAKPMEGSEVDPEQEQEKVDVDSWEGRPKVKIYTQPKYSVGDKVYVKAGRALLGPYAVSSVEPPQKYVLCTDDGEKVEGGKVYDESTLTS